MKDVKLLMAYDENRKSIGDLSSARAKDYAKRWGYGFECHYCTHADHAGRTPYWMKVSKLINALKNCSWLLWLDADTFIVDMDVPLDRIQVDESNLFISQDCGGICTGVVLFKSCLWTAKFLETVDFLGPTDSKRYHEQATVSSMLKMWPGIRENVTLIPEYYVQNPKSPFTSKPFIYHYWAQWNYLEIVARSMKSVAASGWSESCRFIN